MSNYLPNLPIDKNSQPIQEFATAASVKGIYASENASASSVITLTQDTTMIEVVAIGALPTAGVIRWVRTSDTTASVVSAAATRNFDHVIPNNWPLKIAVPIEQNPPTAGSVQGLNRELGLFQRVAIKSIGVASILLTEY